VKQWKVNEAWAEMKKGRNRNRLPSSLYNRPVISLMLRLLGTHRRLPFWGMLLIWLVMSIGFGAYQRFLVQQDQAIAPREQAMLGTVYKVTHGKQYTAHYSFKYEGKEYRNSEITRPDQGVCDVAVYFDPRNPSTNTLVEYRHKINQDRWVMHACGYASIGLAGTLAVVLWIKRSRTRSTEQVSQV
jgi:hypothetical protein